MRTHISFHPGKQNRFLLLLFIVVSSWLTSCQKGDTVDIENALKDEAKSWFSANVLTVQSRALLKMNKLSEKLDWAKASTNSGKQMEYVIVPLKEELKLKANYFMKRAFIFYKKPGDKMEMEVVELLTKDQPVTNLFQSASFLFERKATSKQLPLQIQDVQVFFYDKQYHALNSYEVNKGQWQPLLAKAVNKPDYEQLTTENDGGNGECREWGVYVVTRDQYGNVLDEQLIYTYWVGDCGGGGNGDNPNEEPGEWLGGGEDIAVCTETANAAMAAFVASFQVTSVPISSTSTDIDAITKNRTLKWLVMNGAATWNLQSTEKGVVKLINSAENIWQWESLEHVSLTKTGVAIGGEVDVVSHSGTASFTPGTPNVLYAGMSVDFTLKLVATPIPCPPFDIVSPAVYRSYTANAIWSARP